MFGICGSDLDADYPRYTFPLLRPFSPSWHCHTVLLWFSFWEADRVVCFLASPTAGPVLHLAVGLPGVSLWQQILGLIYESLFSYEGAGNKFQFGWLICLLRTCSQSDGILLLPVCCWPALPSGAVRHLLFCASEVERWQIKLWIYLSWFWILWRFFAVALVI